MGAVGADHVLALSPFSQRIDWQDLFKSIHSTLLCKSLDWLHYDR